MRSVFLRISVRSPVEMRELVKIVPGFVAIVEADINDVGIGLGRAEQHDAHALQIGEIARRRGVRACGRRGARIHRIDVEVFVAAVVFHIRRCTWRRGSTENLPRGARFRWS